MSPCAGCSVSTAAPVVRPWTTAHVTIEPGKRGGKPCSRGMRITVYDVLSWPAAGMTMEPVLEDFPYLTRDDVLACLA